MLKRYPHTAKIIISTEDENGDGIHTDTEMETIVTGRYENESSNKNVDYSAKFYCPRLDFAPFEIDGQTFEFEGRRFLIKHSSIQQTHSEIWLE